ncbi:hypothetical protein GCK32_009837 [Trichostrongylus colubriformis]|uniref:Uncharacterized protein n=1 Tax=Trichostrongylus colubriformis TaxID=6319 RepID=A0AAN8IEC5_TRICO
MSILEQQLHQLRVEKTQQQGRVEELEQRLADEVQASHDLSQALDRESQTRVQLERRLQQWRDGVLDDERISRVSSSVKLESEGKVSKNYICSSVLGVTPLDAVIYVVAFEECDCRESYEAKKKHLIEVAVSEVGRQGLG